MTKGELVKNISKYPDNANIVALFNTDGMAVKRVAKLELFEEVPETTIMAIEVDGQVTDILIVSERVKNNKS